MLGNIYVGVVTDACDDLTRKLLQRQHEASKMVEREAEFEGMEGLINYNNNKECGYMIFDHILISWGNLKTAGLQQQEPRDRYRSTHRYHYLAAALLTRSWTMCVGALCGQSSSEAVLSQRSCNFNDKRRCKLGRWNDDATKLLKKLATMQ